MKGLTFLEEKIYELITKLYNEMQNGFSNIRGDINNMQGDITNMKGDIMDLRKGQVRLENELKENKTALYDGYKQVNERLDALEQKVDKLTVTVESHDVKIEVIRGAK